jgi:dihydropyrimidinase
MSSLLIKGGRVVTASDDYLGDVLVIGEAISLIGRDLGDSADRVIDATGKYVIPGGIDVHTHLSMTDEKAITADTFASGTAAAAFGGTTTIIDFARQERGNESPLTALERRLSQADGQCFIDYGFHIVITSVAGQYLSDLAAMPGEGITSFKLLLAYPGTVMVDDGTAFAAMRVASRCGAIVMLHAENGHVIEALTHELANLGRLGESMHALAHPHLTEQEATQRGIALAEMAEASLYICHVSSCRALEAIESARTKALPVWAETCPQYLMLAREDYESLGFEAAKFVCAPPIRERANQAPLWRGLVTDAISVVSTDHCSYRLGNDVPELGYQKSLGRGDFRKIPLGVPGIENRLQLLYEAGVVSGRFDMKRFVQLVSTNPAKLFGLFPRKGTIAIGSDADIVIWDPNRSQTISAATHHMQVDYNLYEGTTVHGSPSIVISRGQVIVEDGGMLGRAGRGSFLRRQPPFAVNHHHKQIGAMTL